MHWSVTCNDYHEYLFPDCSYFYSYMTKQNLENWEAAFHQKMKAMAWERFSTSEFFAYNSNI